MGEQPRATRAEIESAVESLAAIFGSGDVPNPQSRCPFAKMFGRATEGSLADRLKESTKELHHAAEHHPLQQSIVRGTISRSDYASFASSLRNVHAAMEARLAALAVNDPRIAAIFHERHHRLAAFDRDIALLAGSEVRATPQLAHSDGGVIDMRPEEWFGGAEHAHPLVWIGLLYVVEGSSNGGQVIARVLRRAWGLDDDTLRSLDPHGTETRTHWAAFRTSLDAQSFSSAERDSIVAGAAAAFAGITRLMDSLVAVHAIHRL